MIRSNSSRERKVEGGIESRPRRRAVLLGDVGLNAGVFHTGDEAMMLGAINQLRSRGFDHLTVVSNNATDTSERYGVSSWQVPDLGFFLTKEGLERLLARLRRLSREQVWATSGWAGLVCQVKAGDLAVISGGGNLHDSWPRHVVLRRIFAEIASITDTPLVVSSQSVGPELSGSVLTDVRRIIELSDYFGVREGSIFEAQEGPPFGVLQEKLSLVPDDAMFLRPDESIHREPVVPDLADGQAYVVASFHPYPGEFGNQTLYVERCGQLVRDAIELTGLPVVLLPQEGNLKLEAIPQRDVQFQDDLQRSLSHKSVLKARNFGIDDSVALISSSSLVLSTRYHPVVWALGNAVPAVGLSVDSYTRAKIRGLMRFFEVHSSFLDHASLTVSGITRILERTWEDRRETSSRLKDLGSAGRELQSRWWDEVTTARPKNSPSG